MCAGRVWGGGGRGRAPALADALPPNALPLTYASTTGPAARMLVPARLRAGDWVIVRHQTYSYNAFNADGATGLSLRNVTLWAVAGMGVYTHQCSGISIVGLRIARLPGRPMSITADGMHLQDSAGGGIVISGCWLEGQGDDGLNTPTSFEAISWLAGDRLSARMGGYFASEAPVVAPGCTANFFNRSSMAPLGTARVAGVNATDQTVTFAEPVPPGVELYSLVNNADNYAAWLQVRTRVRLCSHMRIRMRAGGCTADGQRVHVQPRAGRDAEDVQRLRRAQHVPILLRVRGEDGNGRVGGGRPGGGGR